ncbi:hypothetical protein HMPREF0653_00763, partial [Prevotella disiens JCM 6334 = ATCC 29426]
MYSLLIEGCANRFDGIHETKNIKKRLIIFFIALFPQRFCLQE